MPFLNELKDEIVEAGKNYFVGKVFGKNNDEMIYPIHNRDDYKATVTFQPIKTEPANVGDFFESVKGFIGDGINAVDAGGINSLERLAAIPAFLGGYTSSEEHKLKRTLVDDKKITLYLQQAIQFADAVTYGTPNLGGLGATVNNAMNGGGSALGGIGSGITGMLSQAMGDTKTAASTPLARLGTAYVTGLFGEQIGAAGRLSTQTTLNPNTRSVFEAPTIRQFSFTFQLIPTSKKEAEVIQKIIQEFKKELYPTEIRLGGVSVGYEFPNKYEIKLEYNGQPIKGTEMLDCYLREVNVTYNPTAMGMHEGGHFNETSLTLGFMEERAWSKTDYDETTRMDLVLPDQVSAAEAIELSGNGGHLE